ELVAPEGSTHRAAPDDAVLGKVALVDLAAVLADVRCERAGELAVVELAGASLGDSLERPGQIGHGDPVARDEALTSALVDAAALGGVAQDHVEDRVQVGLRARELDAVAGKLDR